MHDRWNKCFRVIKGKRPLQKGIVGGGGGGGAGGGGGRGGDS